MKVDLEAAARQALEALAMIDCQFFACRGPDEPFEDCCTCIRCGAIQTLCEAMGTTMDEVEGPEGALVEESHG